MSESTDPSTDMTVRDAATKFAPCSCSPAREDWTLRHSPVDAYGGTEAVYVCLTCGEDYRMGAV